MKKNKNRKMSRRVASPRVSVSRAPVMPDREEVLAKVAARKDLIDDIFLTIARSSLFYRLRIANEAAVKNDISRIIVSLLSDIRQRMRSGYGINDAIGDAMVQRDYVGEFVTSVIGQELVESLAGARGYSIIDAQIGDSISLKIENLL